MKYITLREITSEEIKNNFEKYYYNHQQFFIKIKNDKDLHIVYLYCIEEWDEKLEDVIYTYGLENKYDDTSYLIDKNENIEHIYILNK